MFDPYIPVPTATVTVDAVIGTCVETLYETGARLESGENTMGNFALCHWLYYKGDTVANGNAIGFALGSTTQWGEVRIYAEEQW